MEWHSTVKRGIPLLPVVGNQRKNRSGLQLKRKGLINKPFFEGNANRAVYKHKDVIVGVFVGVAASARAIEDDVGIGNHSPYGLLAALKQFDVCV